MSDEPLRWKESEEAPADVRKLLAHGRAIPPIPDDVRAALLAALPVPPAAPPPSGPSAGAGAGWSATTWLVGGGVAAVAVAVAVAAFVGRRPPPEASLPAAPSASALALPVPSPLLTLPAPTAAPLPSTIEAPVTPSARSAVRARPLLPASVTAAPSASAPGESNLAEESLLIGRARAALAHSPAQTLAAVDEHARRFPRGELAAEREYLRVSALKRLGRNDEARTRGQRYLTLFAGSPYASGVRSILTELGEP